MWDDEDASNSLASTVGSSLVHRLEATKRRQEAAERREKAAREARELELIDEIRAMRLELQEERKARRELEARVDQIASYRTGYPGRPGAKHLILEEFERRVQAGTVEETLAGESRALAEWLRHAHPDAPQIKPKSIANQLRELHRSWRTSRKA